MTAAPAPARFSRPFLETRSSIAVIVSTYPLDVGLDWPVGALTPHGVQPGMNVPHGGAQIVW
jgi:hypothetical protein